MVSMNDEQTSRVSSIAPNQDIRGNAKELGQEYQKHITDTDAMNIVFYMALSGWRKISIAEPTKTILSVKIENVKTYFHIDRDSRIMDEEGANYLYSSVYPLISVLITTGIVDEQYIWTTWNGKIRSIGLSLLKAYYIPQYRCKTCGFINPDPQEKDIHSGENPHHKVIKILNPYHMDIARYSDVITFLTQMNGITKKALVGFTLTKIADTIITNNQNLMGIAPIQQSQGLFSRTVGRLLPR
jgi:hypothetical protein